MIASLDDQSVVIEEAPVLDLSLLTKRPPSTMPVAVTARSAFSTAVNGPEVVVLQTNEGKPTDTAAPTPEPGQLETLPQTIGLATDGGGDSDPRIVRKGVVRRRATFSLHNPPRVLWNVTTPTRKLCGHQTTFYPHGFIPSTPPIDSVVGARLAADGRKGSVADQIVAAFTAKQADDTSPYFTTVREGNLVSMPQCVAEHAQQDVSSTDGSEPEVQLDVVYTYVNNSAPSFRASRKRAGIAFDSQRYRDWNELLYSLRSVYNRAICIPGTGAGAGVPCVEGKFIRKIHILVAHADQAPKWLNASSSFINVVSHEDVFPSLVDPATGVKTYPHLPTFNSHAIETVLHRIPGLSRFFVYFNNDMILGRRLSFLDYFRPLGKERQKLRNEQFKYDPACRGATSIFEPIIYAEGYHISCTPLAKRRSQSVAERPGGCAKVPLRSAEFFGFQCRRRRRRGQVVVDPVIDRIEFNMRLAFDRLDGARNFGSFAHFPQLMDRDILFRFEDDFGDIIERTRLSRERTTTDVWITMLYAPYAMAHRRAIDTVKLLSEWTAPEYVEHTTDLGPGFDMHNGTMDETHRFLREADAAKLPTQYDPDTMNKDVVKGCSKRKRCTSVLLEKLESYFTTFYEKPSSYRFCQMKNMRQLNKCTEDLRQSFEGNGTRLFLTFNDDWYPDALGDRELAEDDDQAKGAADEILSANNDTAAVAASPSDGSAFGGTGLKLQQSAHIRRPRGMNRPKQENGADALENEGRVLAGRRRRVNQYDKIDPSEYFREIFELASFWAGPAPWELVSQLTDKEVMPIRPVMRFPAAGDPEDIYLFLAREHRLDRRRSHTDWIQHLFDPA